MEPLLWTFDDVVRFILHPDVPVRRWALERLTHLFRDQAGEALTAMLDDSASYIAHQAAEFLSNTGDKEQFGPTLLDHLTQATGKHFGYLALALARMDYQEALPSILNRLDRADQDPPDANEFLYLVSALGVFGGVEARQTLWEILDSLSQDRFWIAAVMGALLDSARPQDVTRLVRVYRSWPPDTSTQRQVEAFVGPTGTLRLTQEIGYAIKNGFEAVLERATWWLGNAPALSEACVTDLATAFQRKHQSVFDVALREAGHIVAERGDDLSEWRAAWEAGEQPTGYRRRALFTLSILEAFAAHPSSDVQQRAQESALALALLCQLSLDRNDAAVLEAAQDPTQALLDILIENRQHVLPDVVERVAALGPEIVPRLIAEINPTEFSWGMIRVVEAIEYIARRHPGSCDAAIPVLIEAVNDEQSSYLLEACSHALEAIGPVAVDAVVEHLEDDDNARQIYLAGVLGEIPTASGAQALLAPFESGMAFEEFHLTALMDTGSPSAIEPLYAIWKADPDDHLLAEALLLLCELNGVQKPELPHWRRMVEAEEARLAQMLGGVSPLLGKEIISSGEITTASTQRDKRMATRKPKPFSKKERKRRAAQKKAQRQKRRKRRK
jgi:hypothetical protein